MNFYAYFWRKLLELYLENTSFNSLQPDTHYSASLLPKNLLLSSVVGTGSPWQAVRWFRHETSICFLTPARKDEGEPGRSGCLRVSSLVSLAAPEGDLRSSENWLLPSFLLPAPSQDISDDGGGWGKGLRETQMHRHQWEPPRLGQPLPLDSLWGQQLARILCPTAFRPPPDSPTQSYQQVHCEFQTNMLASVTTWGFLKMHRLSDKTPMPHNQITVLMDN